MLHPDTVIERYNVNLSKQTSCYQRNWVHRVLDALDKQMPDLAKKIIEILATKAYAENGLAEGLRDRGAIVCRRQL